MEGLKTIEEIDAEISQNIDIMKKFLAIECKILFSDI
jgi:hypothetical protein